ncbi:hypothetical protein Tco_0828885 [Tanacetum coccineum]
MNSIEQCIIERASHEQELKMTLKKLSERQLQIQQCKVQEVQSSVTSSGDETSSGIVSDEEIDKQELEAHYGFMAKIQEVLPAESSSTDTPLEQVQNNDENNVFANERQHSEKNSAECTDERVALANLIANLTLDTEENKTILKQLKKANASLTQELKECRTNLDETGRALGEATSCRDSCLIALQNKHNEFEKYKAFNDRTIDYEILQTKLNETLGLLALKDIEIKEGFESSNARQEHSNKSNDLVINYLPRKAKKSAQLQKDKYVNGKPSIIDPARLPSTANGCKPKPRNWQASMSSQVEFQDYWFRWVPIGKLFKTLGRARLKVNPTWFTSRYPHIHSANKSGFKVQCEWFQQKMKSSAKTFDCSRSQASVTLRSEHLHTRTPPVTTALPPRLFKTLTAIPEHNAEDNRYQANPKESHLVAVKRIFRYLKGTPNLGLWYPKGSGFDLKEYSDSDYTGCNLDRKSTSRGCQIIGGKLIKSQLADYDVLYDKVPIFYDNTSAITISNNPVLHFRTKHIDIRYHFIRDHILKGDIELHFVPTYWQLADIFTKPLAKSRFTRLVAELGMLNIEKQASEKK